MIHTASLVHDDVLDDCSVRRGETRHALRCGTLCSLRCALRPADTATMRQAAWSNASGCVPVWWFAKTPGGGIWLRCPLLLPLQSHYVCVAVVVCPAGKETVNTLYGTRVAVLAGDFLFAQSSWLIANLENMEVSLHPSCCLTCQSRQ
jgi:geranylgeranyl pyrophosphate synthase